MEELGEWPPALVDGSSRHDHRGSAVTGRLCTVEEVAVVLRCKRSKVFQLLADGTLERGPKFGKQTVVTAESVIRALEAGPASHAPKKQPRRYVTRKSFADEIKAVVAKARGKSA